MALGCGSVDVEAGPTGDANHSSGAGLGGSGSGGGSSVGCGEGEITVLASKQDEPFAIALDDTNVYWGNLGSGEVMTMPKSGGTPVVFASDVNGVTALTVTSTHVYWSTSSQADGSGGVIYETPKTGGKAKKKLGSKLARVNQIAVGDDRIYWTSLDGLWSALKTGGGANLVAQSKVPGSWGISLDESRAYWIQEYGILSMPTPVGEPTFFAYAPLNLVVFGMDAANLYLESSEGLIAKPKNGGPAVVINAAGTAAAAMAVTDECLYWTTPAASSVDVPTVGAVRKSGGPLVQMATGKGARLLIAADESGAYWADRDAGTITKVTR